MPKNSYIHKHFTVNPEKPLELLHTCRHCLKKESVSIPHVTSSHYGNKLGVFKIRCNNCGTKASVVKWKLKSRFLFLSGYVHQANDPAEVRKSFDQYIEIIKTLTGIETDHLTVGADEAGHAAY